MVQQHLTAFQREAVSWVKDKESALLACEMGTGKTRISLATVAANPAAHDPGAITVIIAPLATLSQWQKEIATLFGGTAEVHLYRGEHRESKLRQWLTCHREHSGYHFILINPDLWRMDVTPELRDEDEPVSPLAAQEYVYAILDEAHHYRNPRSLLHQTVYYFLNASRRLLLTGTPFFNSPKDLPALARVMSVAPFHQNDWWQCSTDSERESWRIQYCYQVLKDDVLQLPRLESQIHHLRLSTVQRRYYQYISHSRFDCHLVKLLRQRQATCLDAPGHQGQLHNNARAAAIIDIIKSVHDVNPDEKIIVFSVFREFLDLITGYLRQQHFNQPILQYHGSLNTAQRQEVIDDFNATNGAILLISLTAGGAGLNLQSANHVVIAEPYWNYATIGQAIDRIYRLGQQRPCHLHYLVTDTLTDLMIVQKEKDKVERFRTYLPSLTQVTRVDLPQTVKTLQENSGDCASIV